MSINKVILLGPPGSGKGTQAEIISKRLQIAAISTGDMFREAISNETPLGVEAKAFMDAGELVPDATVIGMVSERLAQVDCSHGYLLDGFPRTVPQAEELSRKFSIDLVLEISCDFKSIVDRIVGRRTHPGSGRIYHVETNPPKVEGKDDVTGEALQQRDDDIKEVVENRLKVYSAQTHVLIDYYQQAKEGQPHFASVNGDQAIEKVTEDIIKIISS